MTLITLQHLLMTSAFPALVPPSDLVVQVPRALGMVSLSSSLPLSPCRPQCSHHSLKSFSQRQFGTL